jgi:hypothetical protein
MLVLRYQGMAVYHFGEGHEKPAKGALRPVISALRGSPRRPLVRSFGIPAGSNGFQVPRYPIWSPPYRTAKEGWRFYGQSVAHCLLFKWRRLSPPIVHAPLVTRSQYELHFVSSVRLELRHPGPGKRNREQSTRGRNNGCCRCRLVVVSTQVG